MHILIVDDNEALRQTLAWMFEAMGHTCSLAGDAKEAVRTANQDNPDTVVLDIGLPDMDGYQLCQKLRQVPALKDKVFIAQTGHSSDEHRRKARDAGFDHFLVKPVTFDSLQLTLSMPAHGSGVSSDTERRT